ncbi:Uncharacterised protein [Mycobacteroides abscessus subsp. abscessus]|nr:Uncharacterised protein [Mycobacteroides abscessus subsp. abscessus]
MEPLPKTCLGRVGMRAGIDESIPVRWATAEVSGCVLRECRHRGTDAHLDSCAFSLAHTAEERHHEVVCLGSGINRSADFRHP